MKARSLMLRTAIVCALSGSVIGTAQAGVFLPFGGQPPERVIHPIGYAGSGTNLNISVCLDPAAAPSGGLAQAEQAVRNVVAEFNRMQGQTGNVSTNPTPNDDFEGVLLHEVGHCMGMGHNVFGPSEVGSGRPRLYYANAQAGGNASFDTTIGADNVRGTRDDVRGDDINLNWFRVNVNDPFAALPSVIDRTTYTVNIASLPSGHNYVEVASAFDPCASDANSSGLRSQPRTQNTMYPVLCGNNLLRKLAPDDVALLRIARAGKDGTQGNSDDYTTTLSYAGQTASCDIPIRFNSSTGYARCVVSARSNATLLGSDFAIRSNQDTADPNVTRIEFASNVSWSYNQTDTTANVAGPAITANTPTNGSTTAVATSGTQGESKSINITFTVSGGAGAGTTTLSCSASGGNLAISSGASQTIPVGGSASAVVAAFTLTAAAQNGTVTCTVTPQGGSVSTLTYNLTAPAGNKVCGAGQSCVFLNGFE